MMATVRDKEEQAQILDKLGEAVGDLQPEPGSSTEELHRARIAVLSSLKSGFEVKNLSLRSEQPRHIAQKASSELTSLLASSINGTNQRIQRHVIGRGPLTQPLSNGAELVNRSFGPFLDGSNRHIGLDLIVPVPFVGIQWAGASQPFLYVNAASASGTANTLTLGAGSVWIAASQFVAGAPNPSFMGMSIQSGSVSFGLAVSLTARPIVLPSTASVQLKVKTQSDQSSSTVTPKPNVNMPANATFTFDNFGATVGGALTAADGMSLDFYGSSKQFTWQNVAPVLTDDPPRINFSFKVDSQSLTVNTPASNIAQFSGETSIQSSSWAFTITAENANALAQAQGAGSLSMTLTDGVIASVVDKSMTCHAFIMAVDDQFYSIVGQAGTAQNVPWLIKSMPNSSIAIRTPKPFAYAYQQQFSTGEEVFETILPLTASFDQPRTTNGSRVSFTGSGSCIFSKVGTITNTVIDAAPTVTSSTSDLQYYALKNALFAVTLPTSMNVNITEREGVGTHTVVDLSSTLVNYVPFLPDPYTTNFGSSGLAGSTPSGVVFKISVAFSTTTDEMQVDVSFTEPTPSTAAGTTTSSLSFLSSFTGHDAGGPGNVTAEDISSRPFAMWLDVSSNVSQFGVGLGTVSVSNSDSSDSVGVLSPQITDLMLNIDNRVVNVAALPIVQWEPVYTPDPMVYLDSNNQTQPFPSPLRYDDSGPVTKFSTSSATLVPFSPREAIDGLINGWKIRTNMVTATFTLPFGMVANANLSHPLLLGIPAPGLLQVQPSFKASTVEGGDQISILGVSPRSLVFPPPVIPIVSDSPSIPGYVEQQQNTLPTTNPPLTAISSTGTDVITQAFNDTFSSPQTGKIPVTRIDISGFGASMFSDWRRADPGTGTAITKVEFDVMVGRTAREVVQLASVLHWLTKTRVVRTITIERLNSGFVVRHDSNWQSASEGYFDPGNVTHPGLVTAVTNITNIRDVNTGPPVTVDNPSDPSHPIQMVAVMFDCIVQVQNPVSGATSQGTPVRDAIGYVQMTVGATLNAMQFSQLLTKVGGSLGGGVDCITKIGGSAQTMRQQQVSIAASPPPTGDAQFCIATWGTPVFPGGGQWSFLTFSPGDDAPKAISKNGVPVILQGVAGQTPVAGNPYRFSDPSDLFKPTNPATNYCLCHATGTQKILFPRPVIKPSAPWAMTSDPNGNPFLADSFALGTSTGPFPRFDVCIPFVNANYQLFISPTGDFKLQLDPTSPSITSFTPPAVRRILASSENHRGVVFSGDNQGNPAKVGIAIDTSNTTLPWSFSLQNFSLISECPTFGDGQPDPIASSEVSRIIGSITSDPHQGTQVAGTPSFTFGPAMKPVKEALSFLDAFGLVPPMNIHMTNEWTVDAFIDAQLDHLAELPPIFESLELQIRFSQHGLDSSADFSLKLRLIFGKTWVITFVGQIAWSLSSKGGSLFTLQLGGGAGGDFSFGPFKAFASIEFTVIGQKGSHGWGWGFSLLITAHIDWKLISLEVDFEAGHMSMKTICNNGHDETKWGLVQATVAIDIHLCFIIDLDVTYHSEKSEKYNDGLCDMDIQDDSLIGNPP